MADIREDPMFRQLLQAQKLSRRGLMRGGVTVAGVGALAACGTKPGKTADPGAVTTSGPAAGTAAATSGPPGAKSGAPAPTSAAAESYPDKSATEKKLNWSNWPLYLDVDTKTKSHPTLAAFEKSSGLKVTYTEDVDDNDTFFGKIKPLLQGKQDTGRDLIVLTDWMAGRLIRLGWVEKLDKTKIPNAVNLIDSLAKPGFDPTRDYSLPWQSGMTGIAYNTKATGGVKVETIDQLLTDKKLKGKVTALTEMRDTMGLLLLSMGKDPSNFTDDDFGAAIDKLQKAVSDGQIRQFTGNSYAKPLGQGTVAACIAWSGDVIQLQADNKNIEFATPDTGAMLWADNMMIPNDAKHRANAEMLMDYYYQPEVAAAVADYVNYICPVKGAKEAMLKIDKEAANNPLIFPSADVLAKTHIFKALTTAQETNYNNLFTKVTGA